MENKKKKPSYSNRKGRPTPKAELTKKSSYSNRKGRTTPEAELTKKPSYSNRRGRTTPEGALTEENQFREELIRLQLAKQMEEQLATMGFPRGKPENTMSPGDVLEMYGNPRRQSIADKMGWGRK